MGILRGSGDTEGTWSFSSEKEVKESGFCRMQSPEYSSGVSGWRGEWPLCGFRRGQGKGSICSPRPSGCMTGGRVPDALGIPSRRWRRGSGFPGEVLTLGTDRPPWVPLRPIRGSGVGLRRCGDPGIAGSPDGNPAFDRECPQGLFPWQHRAVKPVGPGPLEAHGWQPPLVLAFVPFLVLGLGVLHNGGRGCRLVLRDLLSQRPETGMARMVP